MFKLWPSLRQYKNWSLPSKLTFIGTFVGVISLTFTLATFFLSDEILNILKEPQERLILSGRWEPEFNHPANSQKLLIGRESTNSFEFRILTNLGANTCDINGIATVEFNGNAKYKEKNTDCKIDFKFKKNDMQYLISQKNCSGYCGLGASFDGYYFKKPEFFVRRGVLTDINSGIFIMLVGNWYEKFYQSMPATFEEENLDKFDSKVHSGGVRGMYTLEEGIIMSNDEGKIWAAVIHDDRVAYFTNDPKYSKMLPLSIIKWMSRFPEKKVWYIGKA